MKIDTTRREEARITVKQCWQRPEIILEGMSGTGKAPRRNIGFTKEKKNAAGIPVDTGAEKKKS